MELGKLTCRTSQSVIVTTGRCLKPLQVICFISGLAVKHDSITDTVNMPTTNDRVGTNRYMPPEVLSEENNIHHHFDSYKQGDIYSLALVFWEVGRRLHIGGE